MMPAYPNIDATDNERIYTHGEKEMEAIKKVQKEGIPVNVPSTYTNELPPIYVNPLPPFSPEQILSMDELAIDCMSYLDINRLYESVLLIHHRGLMDIHKFTDYAKLKQVEQLLINALYKDTENWRIMLSSYDKCHRVNQARLAFLKEQYDKHKY